MIKVGIVEDKKILREGFRTLVNREDDMMCVCTCEMVGEAIDKLPRFAPDVVLMDIQLPDGTGIECTAKLKELMPDIHIVVVTVYEDSVSIFQALQAGACGYLLKMSQPEQVIEAIRDAREGGVPMTPEIARKVINHFHTEASKSPELKSLTARESEILQLIVHGLTNKEIGGRLGISYSAVKFHVQNVYDKLHVHSRVDVVRNFKKFYIPEQSE